MISSDLDLHHFLVKCLPRNQQLIVWWLLLTASTDTHWWLVVFQVKLELITITWLLHGILAPDSNVFKSEL